MWYDCVRLVLRTLCMYMSTKIEPYIPPTVHVLHCQNAFAFAQQLLEHILQPHPGQTGDLLTPPSAQ